MQKEEAVMNGDGEAGRAVEMTTSTSKPGRAAHVSQRGMKITFSGLNYVVHSNVEKGKTINLLKNVSGFMIPGEMAALMGPSGSGKTTLLDVLAGRKTVGQIEGTIKFAAYPPSEMFLRRYTGYVEQFDTLLAMLTVHEMLMYTAELKRPVSESLTSKKSAVETLIGKLALESCRDTRIGNEMKRGISGGQSKRVNIGIALITNPRVLFLDEPTSGLDSYTANEVMTYVKAFAAEGTTICATIHSPSPYAFNLFDRVMMLVRGEMVYFGEQGRAVSYFEALAPEGELGSDSAAEWLTDIIVRAERQGKGHELALKYDSSEIKKTNDAELEEFLKEDSQIGPEAAKDLSVRRATVTPYWFALKTLLKYRTTRNYRDPEFLGPRMGDKIIFVFLMATLYLGIGDDFTTENFQNLSAALFMWCALPAFGALSYVPAIVLERGLFYRERNDGLYRVITYLCAKMVEELILALVLSAVLGIIVYKVIDLQGDFWVFWLVYFGTLANGIVVGYLVSALSPNMDVANAALPGYVVPLLFFAGFLLRFVDIPPWWYWYSYIDFLTYSWGALMKNQFDSDAGRSLTIRTKSGEMTILEYFDLDGVSVSLDVGLLFVFFAVYFFMAFLALTFVKHQKR